MKPKLKRVERTIKNRLGLTLNKANSKFEFKDIVQQILGAILFCSPFIITEELWNLALLLTLPRIILLIGFTWINTTLIVYFSEYQKIKKELKTRLLIPKRLISLFLISYGVSFILLWLFGVLGLKIKSMIWSLKLVVLASFFASIGAATADIIK
jgi:uncharacterized membrane protein